MGTYTLSSIYDSLFPAYVREVSLARIIIVLTVVVTSVFPVAPHILLGFHRQELATFLLVGYFLIFFRIWVITILNNNRFRRELKNPKKYLEIKKDSAFLKDALVLADKMDVDSEKIEFFLSRQSTITPSVGRVGCNVAIVLPRGFIVLLRQQKDIALAFLAHEYAHIIHKDIFLWGISETLSQTLKTTLYPFLFGSIAFAIYLSIADGAHVLQFFVVTIPVVLYVSIVSSVLTLRRRSELLADFASAVHVGPEYMRRAIRNYVVEDRKTLHPPMSLRLRQLGKYEDITEQEPIAAASFFNDTNSDGTRFEHFGFIGVLLRLPYQAQAGILVSFALIGYIYSIQAGYVLYKTEAYDDAYQEAHAFAEKKGCSENARIALNHPVLSCEALAQTRKIEFFVYIPWNVEHQSQWGWQHGYRAGLIDGCNYCKNAFLIRAQEIAQKAYEAALEADRKLIEDERKD